MMKMELLIHFIIPFAFLTLLRVRPKISLIISFLALLPDLDALFLVHRSFSHSLITLAIVVIPLLIIINKLKPKVNRLAWIALFSVTSHIFLDLFSGYTPILWPLYKPSIWVQTELIVHLGHSLNINPIFKLLINPTSFQSLQYLDGPLFTSSGLIFSVYLLAPVLLRIIWRKLGEIEV